MQPVALNIVNGLKIMARGRISNLEPPALCRSTQQRRQQQTRMIRLHCPLSCGQPSARNQPSGIFIFYDSSKTSRRQRYRRKRWAILCRNKVIHRLATIPLDTRFTSRFAFHHAALSYSRTPSSRRSRRAFILALWVHTGAFAYKRSLASSWRIVANSAIGLISRRAVRCVSSSSSSSSNKSCVALLLDVVPFVMTSCMIASARAALRTFEICVKKMCLIIQRSLHLSTNLSCQLFNGKEGDDDECWPLPL
jgi:hypothetical protein